MLLLVVCLASKICGAQYQLGIKTGMGAHNILLFNKTRFFNNLEGFKASYAHEMGLSGELAIKSRVKLCSDLMVTCRNAKRYLDDKYMENIRYYHLKIPVYIRGADRDGFHIGAVNYFALHNGIFYRRFSYNVGIVAGFHYDITNNFSLNLDLQSDIRPTGYYGYKVSESDSFYFSYGIMLGARYNLFEWLLKK